MAIKATAMRQQGLLPDLNGPKAERLKALVSAYLAKTRQKKLIVPMRLPGPTGKAMCNGALIPAPGSAVGRQTFLEWLDGGGEA